MVMADRGFPIHEELLLRFCSLQVLPGARAKSQMTTDECKKTKGVANLATMLHHIDFIVVTCAALSNLKPKLIQKKSNWDHSCFFVFVCFFVCFFFFFAFNHVNAKKKRSQLDFFWVNFVFKCDKTGQPKKCFFFRNEYVGDFATVIAGKEIIFLNLISSIESGP